MTVADVVAPARASALGGAFRRVSGRWVVGSFGVRIGRALSRNVSRRNAFGCRLFHRGRVSRCGCGSRCLGDLNLMGVGRNLVGGRLWRRRLWLKRLGRGDRRLRSLSLGSLSYLSRLRGRCCRRFGSLSRLRRLRSLRRLRRPDGGLRRLGNAPAL